MRSKPSFRQPKKVKIIFLCVQPSLPSFLSSFYHQNKKIPSFNTKMREVREMRNPQYSHAIKGQAGQASRGPIPPTYRWVGCHTLLLAPAKPPFPKTIITRTPRLHHGDSMILRSREGRGSRCIRLMVSRERWRPPWEVGFVRLRTELEDFYFILLNWAKSKILHLGKKFVIFAWPVLLLPLRTLTHHCPNSKSTQTPTVQKKISFNFSFSSVWLVRKLRKMREKKTYLADVAGGSCRWWEP